MGRALERHAEQLANGALAPVGPDDMTCRDHLAVVEGDPHTPIQLVEAGQAHTELDRHAVGEQGAGAPLRDHQNVRIRHLRGGLVQLIHPPPRLVAAGQMNEQLGIVAAGRTERLDQAEVVENLLGARLEALAS